MLDKKISGTRFVLIGAIALTIAGCSSGTQKSGTDNNSTTNTNATKTTQQKPDSTVRKVKAESVFYSIPSPIEVAQLLKKAGAKYDPNLLNPVENVSKYTSTKSKALNLGIYGTDLSFTSIFDQTQESMFYLKCANKLAVGLGINGAFGDKTVSRLEANIDDQDSILKIVSDAYWTTDSYLKDNGRPNTSALIIAGGWIEGLYIASKLATKTNNHEIMNRIAEQKLSLQNLVGLLSSYHNDANIGPILDNLKDIEASYEGIKISHNTTKVTTDKKTGVTTIGGSNKIQITKDQLSDITKKVDKIRNQIIQEY